MASNDTEQLNVLVRVAADRASAQQAGDAIKKNVTDTAQDAAAALGELGPVASAGVRVIDTQLGSLKETAGLVKDQIADLRTEIEQTGEGASVPFDDMTSAAGEAADEVERLKDEIGSIPQDVPLPFDTPTPSRSARPPSPQTAPTDVQFNRVGGLVSQTLSATGLGGGPVVSAAGNLLNATETLSTGMLAATGVATGLGLAVSTLTQRWKDQSIAVDQLLSNQVTVADLVANGATSEEIQAQIDRVGAAGRALLSQADQYSQIADRIDEFNESRQRLAVTDLEGSRQINQQIQEQFDLLSQLSNGAITDQRTLNEYFTNLEPRLKQYETKQTELNAALDAGAFAANDLAIATDSLRSGLVDTGAAALQFVEDLVNSAQEIRAGQIGRSFDFRRQAIDLRDNGSMDDYNRLIRDRQIEQQLNEAQIAQLEALGGSSKQVADQIAQLRQRNEELMQGNQLLADSVYPVIQARQAEADQLAFDQENMNKRLQAQQTAMEAAAAATDTLLKAQSDYTAAQAKVAEATMNLEKVDTDLASAIDKIGVQRTAKETEAAQKRDDALEAQAQKHADKILEINRKADADVETAVFNRDDVARTLAEKKRKEDLTAEEKANQDQQNAIAKAYEDQLRIAQKSAEDSIANERERADRERQIRQTAKNQALADAQNASLNLSAQQKYFNSLAYNQEASDRIKMIQVQQSALATMIQAEYDAGKARAAAFKDGMSAFPMATASASYASIPQAQSAGGVSKVAIPISVTGSSRDQILEAAYSKLSDTLEKMGIK